MATVSSVQTLTDLLYEKGLISKKLFCSPENGLTIIRIKTEALLKNSNSHDEDSKIIQAAIIASQKFNALISSESALEKGNQINTVRVSSEASPNVVVQNTNRASAALFPKTRVSMRIEDTPKMSESSGKKTKISHQTEKQNDLSDSFNSIPGIDPDDLKIELIGCAVM